MPFDLPWNSAAALFTSALLQELMVPLYLLGIAYLFRRMLTRRRTPVR